MLREAGLAALAVLAPALAGCAGPGGGASVSNNPDHFLLSAGGATSGSQTHDWSNSGTTAVVSVSGGGAGSMSVRLTDGAGREVYSDSVSGAGGSSTSERSSTGTPGTWRIHVSWSGAGGFTLRVDRA